MIRHLDEYGTYSIMVFRRTKAYCLAKQHPVSTKCCASVSQHLWDQEPIHTYTPSLKECRLAL